MLLDITVSPCSRVTMFLYMLMQITARLLAFQLFALYWGPGQFYPLVIFVLIHMLVSALLHITFSEDLFYLHKGKYLKFLHNTIMNAFATIYFHNYLRMDEMPSIGRRAAHTRRWASRTASVGRDAARSGATRLRGIACCMLHQ